MSRVRPLREINKLTSHENKIQFIRDQINFFANCSEADRDSTVNLTPDTVVPSLSVPTTSFSTLKGISKPLELLQNARNNELEHLESNPHIPYLKYTNCTEFTKQDYFKLVDETVDFNYRLNGRDIAYYGDYDYRYTGAKHTARPISGCVVLDDISKQIATMFPVFKFNSVLVLKYPNGASKCPAHSDDESSIAPDSLILSLSLGAQRSMNVRRKMEFVSDSFVLNAGDILIMSKAIQSNYDHAIPESGEDAGARISLTFRLIQPTRGFSSYKPDKPRTTLPETHRRPKRVLVLSDSRNLGFDTADFKSQSVVCFKEACYTLDNISQHESKIAQADLVLISTGINDIIRERGNASRLFIYLRNLMHSYYSKYPDKMFIFYAVPEVTGKYIDFNPVIDTFNDYCFELSLRSPNFKLFNNIFFDSTRHLASDGLHLSKLGKWSASVIWTQAALGHGCTQYSNC